MPASTPSRRGRDEGRAYRSPPLSLSLSLSSAQIPAVVQHCWSFQPVAGGVRAVVVVLRSPARLSCRGANANANRRQSEQSDRRGAKACLQIAPETLIFPTLSIISGDDPSVARALFRLSALSHSRSISSLLTFFPVIVVILSLPLFCSIINSRFPTETFQVSIACLSHLTTVVANSPTQVSNKGNAM